MPTITTTGGTTLGAVTGLGIGYNKEHGTEGKTPSDKNIAKCIGAGAGAGALGIGLYKGIKMYRGR